MVLWIPAFAGMTARDRREHRGKKSLAGSFALSAVREV